MRPWDLFWLLPGPPGKAEREGRAAILGRSRAAACAGWGPDKAHPPGSDLSAVGGPRSS